jgi:tRNA pseudouridine13 synthase
METKQNMTERQTEGPIIKFNAEDFQVNEIPEEGVKEAKNRSKGKYGVFLLEKRNIDMMRAVRWIASELRIPQKFISFSGTKDKKALTKQYISIKGKYSRELELRKKDGAYVRVERVGFMDKPISLGDHDSNEFKITIRNLDESFSIPEGFNWNSIPNYFHNQRFGIQGNNHVIGERIIRGNYKEAWMLAKKQKSGSNAVNVEEESKENSINALRGINRKLAGLYVSAFQSYIFNNAIAEWIKDSFNHFLVDYNAGELAFINEKVKKGIENQKVMLPGFGFESKGEIGRYIQDEMKKMDIGPRDFIIRQLPRLSAEAVERNVYIDVKEAKKPILDKDECFKGKKKLILDFGLGKGSYATIVIAALCRRAPVELKR